MRTFSLLALLAFCAALLTCTATAVPTTDITGTVRLNGSTTPLDIQSYAVLSTADLTASDRFLSRSEIFGPPFSYNFKFSDVPQGEYVLRVESRRWAFQEYFIKISPTTVPPYPDPSVLPPPLKHDEEEADDDDVEIQEAVFLSAGTATTTPIEEDEADETVYLAIEVSLWSSVARAPILGSGLKLPLVLRSLTPLSSLPPPPPPFSLLLFLKSNPMVWVIGLGALLAVGTPWLVGMLDEEVREEVGRNQAGLHGQLGSLQNFDASSTLSRYLSGSGSGSSTPSSSTPAPSTLVDESFLPTQTGGGGGGGKGGKARKRK